jgi:hypothetical protein
VPVPYWTLCEIADDQSHLRRSGFHPRICRSEQKRGGSPKSRQEPIPASGLTVQEPTDSGASGGVSSSIIQRITGVPSRGTVLIRDQPSLSGFTDIVGRISSLTVAFVCRLGSHVGWLNEGS